MWNFYIDLWGWDDFIRFMYIYINMKKIYTSDGVYNTKNYELSSLFLDDGNFPLNSVINWHQQVYTETKNEQHLPKNWCLPWMNWILQEKSGAGSPQPKNEAGNRKPLGRGKKNGFPCRGAKKQISNSSNSSKNGVFELMMCFFCFSKGVVGYDSQPRSGVTQCIYTACAWKGTLYLRKIRSE